MIVAFSCIRTSIMYKYSGFGICPEFTQNFIYAYSVYPKNCDSWS